MPVNVNLLDDFVEQIRSMLGLDETLDQFEVIISFAWFDLRRLPQKKWKVHFSKEITQNQFFINNKEYIERLREKAESGEDLTPHASTLITNIQGKDDMLADWGIYHLHPGHGQKRPSSSGFVNRAGELIFVFPHGNDLYFLDILDHGAWTNFSLIQIIHENWPLIIESYKLKGALGLSHEPTETELYELRKHQINSAFRIVDSFYMGPGGGLASDGSSAKAVRMAMNVKKLLENYSLQLKEDEPILRKELETKTVEKLNEILDLKLIKYDPKKGDGEIIENNSNIKFSFCFS
jgi:hypothetical protein